MQRLSRTLTSFFSSQLFWRIVMIFFVIEALWFVFSAAYPMAFDEDFHLGVIRIYAHGWSPFLTEHPAGADQFGAVVRDPSFLFHYLMSFPYRLLQVFTHSEAAQVIGLRLLNVAMFTAGLVLFRKVMLRAGASKAFAHVTLALFILLPIVPQLAAHINYDNLLMLLLPLWSLAVFALLDGLKARRVNVPALLSFIALSLGMSVVKYATLPFLVAAALILMPMTYRYFRGHGKEFWPSIKRGFTAMALPSKVALVALCAVLGVLFVQRYGVNMVQYKTPVPDCGQVLRVDQCMSYGPWGRDYVFAQNKPDDFVASPFTYIGAWFRGMWFRTFFAVNGAHSDFTTYQPLPVPANTAIVISVTGLLVLLFTARRVFRNCPYLVFFLLVIVVYAGVLWWQEYGMYKDTGQPVAINGRYLLPILPLAAVILGRAMSLFITARRQAVKAGLACAALVLFLHGGGVFTFILRSDAHWYWPNKAVNQVNHGAQKVLAPITIEGSKY